MDLTMSTNVSEFRRRPADSEKITINLGYVDLGQVDLMVKDGFYSNRIGVAASRCCAAWQVSVFDRPMPL
jgi:hypothetical protein